MVILRGLGLWRRDLGRGRERTGKLFECFAGQMRAFRFKSWCVMVDGRRSCRIIRLVLLEGEIPNLSTCETRDYTDTDQ